MLPNDLTDKLLELPTVVQQSRLLQGQGLLTPEGVLALLDAAAQLLRSDPRQGRQLAALCAAVAEEAAAPQAVPRAHYLCAQGHAINAEFKSALELIAAARQGYLAQGLTLDALRTNIGLMNVLGELGRYGEALAAGDEVLTELGASGERGEETLLLVALVQQSKGLWYEQTGRYEEALAAYAAAETHYRTLALPEQIGAVSNNRGIALLSLGRGSAALAAFEAAAQLFAEAGLTLLHAQTLINIGDAHLLLGNYARSLTAFEQARKRFSALNALAEEPVLLLDSADAYLALNLAPEALAAYRTAEAMLRAASKPYHLARTLWGKGLALVALSHLDLGEEALTEAARLFHNAANLPLLADVTLELAGVQLLRGDQQAALATARNALDLLEGHDWPIQQINAHLRIADMLLPDLAAAQKHLLTAQALADALGLALPRYRVQQRLGHLLLLQGRSEAAHELLSAAVDAIEQLRSALPFEAVRASFLHDKTAPYEDLVRLYLDGGTDTDHWQAFAVAERARSRALVDLLSGVVEPLPATTDETAAAQLRALRGDLTAIYSELLGGGRDEQRPLHSDELRERAAALEREIGLLRLQGAAAAPDRLEAPLSLAAFQAALPADTVMISYFILGSEIIVFVSRGDTLHVARGLGSLPTVERLVQRLTAQWDRFRAGRQFVGKHMALLEQSARRVLAELYAALVAPIEPLLAQGTTLAAGSDDRPPRLVVVPHGLLHQVPFHALHDGRGYLLERFEIAYAPSATVLDLCARRAAPDSERALVVGVADELIPAAVAEAAAVARQLPNVTLLLDEEATLPRVRAAMAGCATLHIASHGLFRSDNPIFSSLKLADGWLGAVDIMEIDLAGALVVLSACESGRSQVLGGDELIGLTRAFLGAGAATLVVSLWLVQDDTTPLLMESWYAHLHAGVGRATALRAAQLALMANYPHPYYWAPFVLIGQR